jgi:hypothetical protein
MKYRSDAMRFEDMRSVHDLDRVITQIDEFVLEVRDHAARKPVDAAWLWKAADRLLAIGDIVFDVYVTARFIDGDDDALALLRSDDGGGTDV